MYKSLVGTARSWINKAVLRIVYKVKKFLNYCRLAMLRDTTPSYSSNKSAASTPGK